MIDKVINNIWPPARHEQQELDQLTYFSLRDDMPEAQVTNREKVHAQILLRTPDAEFIDGLEAQGYNPTIIRRLRKRLKETRISLDDLQLLHKLHARPEQLRHLEQLRCEQTGLSDPYLPDTSEKH